VYVPSPHRTAIRRSVHKDVAGSTMDTLLVSTFHRDRRIRNCGRLCAIASSCHGIFRNVERVRRWLSAVNADCVPNPGCCMHTATCKFGMGLARLGGPFPTRYRGVEIKPRVPSFLMQGWTHTRFWTPRSVRRIRGPTDRWIDRRGFLRG